MRHVVSLDLAGLGIIVYSPWAARHIQPGEDYLERAFTDPADVGAHIRACTIAAFCTGSSGRFHLHVTTEPIEPSSLRESEWQIALGVEVRDSKLCLRDLYTLLCWDPECPPEQELHLPDGFYHITAFTSTPESGCLGDDQAVYLHLRHQPERPELTWQGVPQLC